MSLMHQTDSGYKTDLTRKLYYKVPEMSSHKSVSERSRQNGLLYDDVRVSPIVPLAKNNKQRLLFTQDEGIFDISCSSELRSRKSVSLFRSALSLQDMTRKLNFDDLEYLNDTVDSGCFSELKSPEISSGFRTGLPLRHVARKLNFDDLEYLNENINSGCSSELKSPEISTGFRSALSLRHMARKLNFDDLEYLNETVNSACSSELKSPEISSKSRSRLSHVTRKLNFDDLEYLNDAVDIGCSSELKSREISSGFRTGLSLRHVTRKVNFDDMECLKDTVKRLDFENEVDDLTEYETSDDSGICTQYEDRSYEHIEKETKPKKPIHLWCHMIQFFNNVIQFCCQQELW